MAIENKIRVSILVQGTGESVCFKQDGLRFTKEHTVKLNVDTEYQLRLVLRPAFDIKNLMINGNLYTFKRDSLPDKEDEESVTYMTNFSTEGYEVSKRSDRKDLLIVLQFENGVYMEFNLQCKLYKAGEINHSHWGQKLTAFDIDYEMLEGQGYVSIIRERFL